MIWISIYSPIVPVGNQVVLSGRLLHPLLTPRTLVRSVTVPYNIVALLDNFVQNGPNGEHLCLVMKLLGESLVTMRRRLQGFRFPISVVKQLHDKIY